MGTEVDSGQNQWYNRLGGILMPMQLLRGVRLGSQMTYAAWFRFWGSRSDWYENSDLRSKCDNCHDHMRL